MLAKLPVLSDGFKGMGLGGSRLLPLDSLQVPLMRLRYNKLDSFGEPLGGDGDYWASLSTHEPRTCCKI